MLKETAHSILGASGAYRWMKCPGQPSLAKDLPDKESIYAREGSAAHYMAEQAFGKFPPMRPSLMWIKNKGKRCPGEYEDINCTEEMLEALDAYYEHVNKLYYYCGKHLTFEQKFKLDWLHPGLFGTVDCCAHDEKGTMWVTDYKHGSGVVIEVINNPQLMYYALGAIGPDNPLKIEKVILTICQPRAYHDDGPTRSWETTSEQLYTWARDVLKPAAMATTEPEAPLVAGDHCKFCKAMAICPQVAAESLAVAQQEFSVVEGNQEINLPGPESLNIHQICRVLDFSAIISDWANKVKEHAQTLAEAGTQIPGHKLVQKRSIRKWRPDATGMLVTMFGDEAYQDPKVVGIPEAEKRFGKKVVADLWVKPDTGLQLVADSDKRKAVTPSAVADFLEDADFLQ